MTSTALASAAPPAAPPAGSPAAPLAAFDALRRGDAAPGWLAGPVLRAWDLDPATTTLTLIAVSENATFLVRAAGEPVSVLRVHRPGYVADPGQIVAELSWVRALRRDTDVRVPDVVPTRDGDLVAVLDAAGTRWYVVAFGHVRGDVLEDVADPRPWYGRIGATTAHLHEHVARWSLPAGASRFSWRLTDALGAASRWGDWRAAALAPAERALLERAETAARDDLADLPTTGPGWGLVHADLRPSNVLVDGDDLTVIDFDDCGTTWLLWDFAAALSFIEHEPHAPELARSWVEGYRSVRDLPGEALRTAAALSTVRRLQMLGWTTTHRADALPAAVWDAQVPGTLAVAERYLARRTWLFD
ncbi:phosphotransferase enzyme family protein [Kineococcus sp. SYSU DK004]|uniref:phosphotransferase enzyme family protein n=1 Tax=Kineococcus sp. SYSU DK004 TaxID=3383125 RepID=UPI003D7D49F3